MNNNFGRATRFGISAASAITSIGFSAAKYGTNIGFGIARGVTSTFANGVGTLIDYAVFGGDNGTGNVIGSAVTNVFNLAETMALAPILLGESVTSTSLVAASGSLDVLASLFETDDASFSLASFVQLVRREWNSPVLEEHLPPERYSVAAVARALVAWAAIQSVTHEYQESIWHTSLRELSEEVLSASQQADTISPSAPLTPKSSQIHVTQDTLLPDNGGQILMADIGENKAAGTGTSQGSTPHSESRVDLLMTLRRFSKMVLAGYGGPSLIFFGVPLSPQSTSTAGNSERSADPESSSKSNEETLFANVMHAAQADRGRSQSSTAVQDNKKFSWWNVLLGKHDQEIFESFAFTPADSATITPQATATVGSGSSMPRYWILTDHARRQVVVVLRGTMSINELAVDLTCDPEPFSPVSSSRMEDWSPEEDVPGFLSAGAQETSSQTPEGFQVHSGIKRLAYTMGSKGGPLHMAVRGALRRNDGYELVLCGHSLGAGVAAMLALMWADPNTCLTVRSSGLPSDRRTSAFLFAPPCLTSLGLSTLCTSLITSLVYSHDVVSRLSLGSVRDLTRAAMWLCAGKNDETPLAISTRALKLNSRFRGNVDEESEINWFLSLRKTLEANMGMAHLYPPGRVLWAVRRKDLSQDDQNSSHDQEGLRLFEVTAVDKVFSQIVFSRDMLGSHMPHQYDRIIHELV
ncbi:alpha/beta-hydrolase [Sistotremastrum niveocremeum HHB9708]|uniref:sn-1-specific diacylglycerol lipase n=1 Tax=Sistotremastrum niveocremeum HHB9708 TaxID=1314777 RepID=A0A164VG10_9AGAM|nr:alpha/beta-hydrolase [Sistotremastrum niveocremeum HHB9708]